jgi:two-component system, OmpR family, response regulator
MGQQFEIFAETGLARSAGKIPRKRSPSNTQVMRMIRFETCERRTPRLHPPPIRAMCLRRQYRRLMEKSMLPEHDGWGDNTGVCGESDDRRLSTPVTAGAKIFGPATTNEPMPRLLLIEDDKETADQIGAELRDRGFDVNWAANGIEGLDKARSAEADVMIVDRLLPGMDGLTIIKTLRDEGIRAPVLVLSALGAADERVRGLRAGGDDYLTKPFATVELVARIEALLRRPAESPDTVLRVGPLELDLIKRTATRGERTIDLLPREFRLLEYMMRRKGQMLTRTMLLEEVWNYKFVPRTNLVDVHMGRLRHKVDEKSELPMINNFRGVGFILRAPD